MRGSVKTSMFDLATIGRGLPVLETIDSLPSEGHVVVQAPPGTGKTTLVPPALANQVHGTVLVTCLLYTSPSPRA